MTPFKPSDQSPLLETLSAQVTSPELKTRILAMLELQKASTPADVAYPLLQIALQDSAEQVRGMAAFALGVKPGAASLPLLLQAMSSDPDYNVRAMAAGALGYLGDRQALAALSHAFFEDTNWLVQFSAAVALGNLKDPKAIAVLLEALNSDQSLLQEAAIMAIGEIGAVDQVEQVLRFVAAEDWIMRKHVADALGNLPSPQSQSALNYLSQDANSQVADAATLALERLAELS
ncbi:MAG: HEAT repeat domain-containing protein [Cyanobacteria bacterium P01_C01_bin.120]